MSEEKKVNMGFGVKLGAGDRVVQSARICLLRKCVCTQKDLYLTADWQSNINGKTARILGFASPSYTPEETLVVGCDQPCLRTSRA